MTLTRASLLSLLLVACGGQVELSDRPDAVPDASIVDAGSDIEDAAEAEASICGPGKYEVPDGCYTCEQAGGVVWQGLVSAWDAAKQCETGDKCVWSGIFHSFCIASCGTPVAEKNLDALHAELKKLQASPYCVCPHGEPPECFPPPDSVLSCVDGGCK